jgi:hypothetical protein
MGDFAKGLPSACCALLLAAACEPATGAGELPALTREELLDPAQCKSCHPKHYEQWSASIHAYATEDPVFVAMNKRGQEETEGELGAFCVSCHAPMAVREDAFAGEGVERFADVAALPKHLQGITCYFCHNAVGVREPHNNGNVELADDDVMRAAVDNPIQPTTHKVAFSRYHDPGAAESSLLCGTCHDIVTPRGVPLETTYEEYSDSIHAQPGFSFQSCQDCHMAYVEDKQPIAVSTGRPGELTNAHLVHSHLWPAVDLPLTDWPHADAMRSAVENCMFKRPDAIPYLTLERDPGALGTLTVALETEAGHNMPTGASQDRRMWVEVHGLDDAGVEQYGLGVIADGEIEQTPEAPHPCMYREYMLDDQGHETHDFWEAAVVDRALGKRLPYKVAGSCLDPICHSVSCTFQPPLSTVAEPSPQIEVRVRMRPMGMDVLSDLVSTGHLSPDVPALMPTMTVTTAKFVYREVTRSYELQTLSEPNCDEWLCLIDANSPACASSADP